MADLRYITITGEAQGLISKGCSAQDSVGNKCQLGHLDQIQVLSFTHNIFVAGDSNQATHGAFIITKNIDKSTPLLGQARKAELRD